MDAAPTTHLGSDDLPSTVFVAHGRARPDGRRGWRLALTLSLLALVAAACGADATDGAGTPAGDSDAVDSAGDGTASSAEDDAAVDSADGTASSAEDDADDHAADDDASDGDPDADDPDTAARAGSYDAPALTIDVDADYRATIETALGAIEVDLYAQDAPVTVNSFVFLAREGYYDGLIFHRVIPGFVAQGGDPLGSGMGGPGYAFEDELTAAERDGYPLGTLAMANSGPNTNGSQFFLTVDDVDLPPLYAVFGRVTSGLEVLQAIAAQGTDARDRPLEDIRIHTIEVEGP